MLALKSPLYAQIELTYGCNLACRHCYNESKSSRISLDDEKSDRIVRELADNDIFAVTITGGEIFTERERLYHLIERLKEEGLDVNINSNLTLATEDDARRIASYGDIGILTSFASYDEATNDAIMGAGSQRRILTGIEMMLQQGIVVAANMVVSKQNYKDVYETGKLMHSRGVRQFQLGHFVPTGVNGGRNLENFLEKEHIISSLEELARLSRETEMYVRLANAIPYCIVGDDKPELRTLLMSVSCNAGRSIIQIGSNGAVKPCPNLNNSYGNILTEGLQTVWQRMQNWSRDEYVPKKCQPCDSVVRCKGSCRADALTIGGNLITEHPFWIEPIKLDSYRGDNLQTLTEGTRLFFNEQTRARVESEGLYTLFAENKYLVVPLDVYRLITSIKLRGEITVDSQLLKNKKALRVLSSAIERGILIKKH